MSGITKLTVIGGGSSYTPELLDGFIRQREDLSVDEIVLFDIDQERLAIIAALAKRMFAHAGLQTRVEIEQDRREAIAGADFIISQIRVGQIAARILDERIPLKYHLLGQETVGVGGLFNALRTIPVALAIARDVAELAPGAWLLNFTNPSGIITEALIKYSGLDRVIGLCNVPINSQRAAAELLGVEAERLWLDWIGLNHLAWIRGIFLDGRQVLPEWIERLEDSPAPSVVEHFPFSSRMISELGLLPTSYLRYYYDTQGAIEAVQRAGKTRGEVVQELEKALFARYRDPELTANPEELKLRGGAFYSDAAMRLIISLITDKRDIQILITCNNGAIEGLPQDVSVEVPAVVGAHGVTPLARGEPPLQIKALLHTVKLSESLVIEAAVNGSRRLLLHALLANPLVEGYAPASQIMEEMLQAHRCYLSQFQ